MVSSSENRGGARLSDTITDSPLLIASKPMLLRVLTNRSNRNSITEYQRQSGEFRVHSLVPLTNAASPNEP